MLLRYTFCWFIIVAADWPRVTSFGGSSNGSDNNNVGSNLSETRDNDAVGGTSNVLVQAHTHCIMFTSGYFRPMDL